MTSNDDNGGAERGELLDIGNGVPASPDATADGSEETVSQPAKVMRIGSMIKQLLDEVRQMQLDDPSRDRLGEIYDRSIVELTEALSTDLQEELRSLALPLRDGDAPTDAELRVAKAQLVGWLEGLFHGIQATLFAQQMAARQQLEQMRQLPQADNRDPRPGTYL
ncbi:MAG: proteasome activator [Ilumatobacteraceae bacterium]